MDTFFQHLDSRLVSTIDQAYYYRRGRARGSAARCPRRWPACRYEPRPIKFMSLYPVACLFFYWIAGSVYSIPPSFLSNRHSPHKNVRATVIVAHNLNNCVIVFN